MYVIYWTNGETSQIFAISGFTLDANPDYWVEAYDQVFMVPGTVDY